MTELTGRMVTETPTLIAPPSGAGMPQTARWRVRIDGPGALRALDNGRGLVADELFANVRMFKEPPHLSVAALAQPSVRDVRWSSDVNRRAWGERRALRPPGGPPTSIARVSRRPHVPVAFDRVAATARR